MITIKSALFPDNLSEVKGMFREYANSLDVDLDFQDFEVELSGLPGKYAEPSGIVLLARSEQEVVGCIALRMIDSDICEMKRLYVKPQVRSKKVGRLLVEQLCAEARKLGYQKMYLDTIPSMSSAVRLYTSLGFKPIKPYIYNPLAGAMFLGLDLNLS